MDVLLTAILLISVTLVLFASVLVHLNLTHKCYERLRNAHPAEFESLGKPHLFWNNSFGIIAAFAEFVRSGRYLALQDDELKLLIERRRVAARYSYGAFAAVLVLFFLFGHD